MSHVLNAEQQIDVWIENVRRQLEAGDTEKSLMFLDTLQKTWERHKRGEQIEPMTIYTGADV